MPEDTTSRKQVTFTDGLPCGTRATFKHDDQFWVAYPASKDAAIVAVLDRLLGVLAKMNDQALRSINAHPDNPELMEFAARILGTTAAARELAVDKREALTQ